MNPFEDFNPAAWVDEGMVTAFERPVTPAQSPQGNVQARTSLKKVTLVMSLISVTVLPSIFLGNGEIARPTGEALMQPRELGAPDVSQESSDPFSDGYWSRVRDYLRSLPQARARIHADVDYMV